MAMPEPRVSQLLPTIKCNNCGCQVEFRKLSDHECNAVPETPALPNKYRGSNDADSSRDYSFSKDSYPGAGDSSVSLGVDDSLLADQDSFDSILPDRSRKGAAPREPLTDYASRFAEDTKNEEAEHQTASFLERYNQLIGDERDASRFAPRDRKPQDLKVKTDRDADRSANHNVGNTSVGSLSSPGGPRTQRTRSDSGSPPVASRPIDISRSMSPNHSRTSESGYRSTRNTRQDSGDQLSPHAASAPQDAFFDMRSASPRPDSDHWSNPRPVPKPPAQRGPRDPPLSPTVMSDFERLNLESTRPAPRPPPSTGRRTPSASGGSGGRSRTPQHSDGNDAMTRGRSPAPAGSQHSRHTSASSSNGSLHNQTFTAARNAPPVPRNGTSDEHPRHLGPGSGDFDPLDEPLSPASRPGSHRQCTACRNKIGGAGAIHLADSSFHRTCFRCSECRRSLDVCDDYIEQRGRVLCSECSTPSSVSSAAAKAPPTCAGCNAAINGKAIKALGSFWHETHLTCAHCRRALTRGHVEHRGRAYCPEDFAQLFLPKCKGCKKPVEREALVALDGKWHPRCFNCQVCHKPFPDKSFYVFEKQPYCKYHYHMLNNSLCKRCESPIEGACAQVLEGRFHPACFSCETCEMALTDIYYNFQGRFFCEHDVTAIQRRMNAKADRRRTMMKHI